jgi:ABC-type transporter Mla subunit MlaD
MFGKMKDLFDDFDAEKVMEVVNLVWNNREKFIDLVEQLPEMLQQTGDTISSAGESAVQASLVLSGGKDEDSGADDLLRQAAVALDKCTRGIAAASTVMGRVGGQLDEVRIPSVKPQFTEVMGFNVISGLDLGEESLLGKAADQLREGSGDLQEIKENLQAVAGNMRQLGTALAKVSGDLNNVGLQLQESGGTLRSVSELGSRK